MYSHTSGRSFHIGCPFLSQVRLQVPTHSEAQQKPPHTHTQQTVAIGGHPMKEGQGPSCSPGLGPHLLAVPHSLGLTHHKDDLGFLQLLCRSQKRSRAQSLPDSVLSEAGMGLLGTGTHSSLQERDPQGSKWRKVGRGTDMTDTETGRAQGGVWIY